MYTQLASRLALSGDGDFEVTQAVATAGSNAASVEMTIFGHNTGTVNITIEGSNDLENWTTLPTGVAGNVVASLASIGYTEGEYFYDSVGSAPLKIAFAYVRLRYTLTEGAAVLAGGINLFNA